MRAAIESLIGPSFTGQHKDALVDFIVRLYNVYADFHFAYPEINPLVVPDDGSIHCLDMAAKLDQTAEFICGPKWAIVRDLSVYDGAATQAAKNSKVSADRSPPMVWPAPFRRDLTKEGKYQCSVRFTHCNFFQ